MNDSKGQQNHPSAYQLARAARSINMLGRWMCNLLNGDYQGLLNGIKSVPEIKGIDLAGSGEGVWHLDIRPGSRVCFRYSA
ncbi:MAG: hypothetical protein ACPGVO_07865 [Spirulinaceae cyanobacterium]